MTLHLLLPLALTLALTASATEYFATPDFGDDSAKDCLTEATAGSLTNAMARAKADSDIVTLLPGEGGVYDMTAFTAKSGVYFAISKKITVRSKAEDPATVTLLGGGSANPARLFTFPNTSASLRGVTVTNFYSSSSTVGLVSKGLVSNCVFAANATKGRVGTCVNDSLCDDCVFSDNVCNNSGTHWTGGGAGSGGTYLNCRFFRNQAVTSAHQSNGGALYLPSFVSNCVFVGNYATQRGGAIGTAQNASYTIRVVDSFFTNNLAGSGGGAVYGVTVSNCVISSSAGRCTDGAGAQYVKAYDTVFADNICSNYTHYHGGGAAAYGYYYHCRFERNKVVQPSGHQSFGGAILQPTLVSNCVFISNYCADRGGAIGSEGSSANYNSVIMESYFTNNTSGASAGAIYGATMSGCIVSGSQAKGSYGGGAAYVRATNCQFIDNAIVNNSSNLAEGGGGQAYGSALNCVYRGNSDLSSVYRAVASACCNVAMTNCLVYGNVCKNESNSYAGGGAVWAATAPCVNCTIVSNYCKSTSVIGAAAGKFVNCIILGNVPNDVYAHSNSGAATLTNCIYATVGAGTTPVTSGCVQVADKTGAKFRSWDMTEPNAFWLYSSSPAKNHGFDVGFTERDRDLAGKPRLNGPVDMGCYEFHPACGLMVIVR